MTNQPLRSRQLRCLFFVHKEGPVKPRQIAESVLGNNNFDNQRTAWHVLKTLKRRGLVEVIKRGSYSITGMGVITLKERNYL